MDAKRADTYRRRLYSRAPLLGGLLRRRAASTLAQDGSDEAVEVLAEAILNSSDSRVREIALQGLLQNDSMVATRALADVAAQSGAEIVSGAALSALRMRIRGPRARAIAEVWAATRHTDLAALLVEHKWIAPSPLDLTVLTALKVGQVDIVESGTAQIVEPLMQACQDGDPEISERAYWALRNLRDEGAQDALCRFYIEHDSVIAHDAVLDAGYALRDEQQRAVFLFLSAQWERYDLLDYDRRFLRTAYATAGDDLRGRIRDRLRAAGRTDFMSVLAGEDYRSRIAQMSAAELDLLQQTLTANRDWATLWDLVFEVPFERSVQAVTVLARDGWQPEREDERPVFDELVSYTRQDMATGEEQIARLLSSAMLHALTGPEQPLFSPALLQAQARVPGRINAVAFAPDRPVIAIGTGGRKVVLWNYQRARTERVLGGFDHSIGSVTFAGDGGLLCAERTNRNGTQCAIYTWDAAWDRFRLGQHSGSVTALEAMRGSQVLSAGRDGDVVLWDVRERREIQRKRHYKQSEYYPNWARAIASSPDGQRAALQGNRLDVITLPLMEGLCADYYSVPARAAAYMPNGQDLVIGTPEGDVVVCNTRWQRVREHWWRPNSPMKDRLVLRAGTEVLVHHEGRLRGVEVLANENHPVVISAGFDGYVHFVLLNERAAIGSVQVPRGQLTSMHISPDGSFMALGSSVAELSLWDLRTLSVQGLFRRPFAQATASLLPVYDALAGSEDLPSSARLALRYAICVLRHRSRFDIEIGRAPSIMVGEFDIELASADGQAFVIESN